MNGIEELAVLLKSLNDKKINSFELGTVISITPLKVKLDKMPKIILDENDLVIPKYLKKRIETVKINGVNQEIEYEGLKNNDRIIALQSSDQQKYLIIGVI